MTDCIDRMFEHKLMADAARQRGDTRQYYYHKARADYEHSRFQRPENVSKISGISD